MKKAGRTIVKMLISETRRQREVEEEEDVEQRQVDDQEIFTEEELGRGADRVDDLVALVEDRGQEREAVLQEHDVRDLLRDLAALLHSDAHVCGLDGGQVVDAVADHRRVNLLTLERLYDAQLVVGPQARKDDVLADYLEEFRVLDCVESLSRDELVVGNLPAYLAHDGLNRLGRVARQNLEADVVRLEEAYGLHHVVADLVRDGDDADRLD